MEFINLFMGRAIEEGLFQGIQLPEGGPNISNLCYADDVLFLGLWSDQNVVTLKRLLRWLGLISGLKVKQRKCKLYGIGVDETEVSRMAALLNCEAGKLPFLYLGVPIGANMKRKVFWAPVIDRLKSKLSKWKTRHLSFAGRLTLAKTGITDAKKKLRWVKWDLVSKSKKFGGLAVRRIRDFNLAMLTKWWWRFKSNPNQLWAKVVALIHNNNSTDQLIPLKNSVAGVWKVIGSMSKELSKIGINISDNLISENGSWKWRNNSEELFSVKQVRQDIEGSMEVSSNSVSGFDWLSCPPPPKTNFLLWRALLGKIASREGLARRGAPMSDVSCPRCGMEAETSDHIFFNCLWARCIWWNVLAWVRIKFPLQCSSLPELISVLKDSPGGRIWKRIVRTIVCATVWRIWSARNAKVFEDCFIPINKTFDLIKEDAFLWICNRANLRKPSWESWELFDVVGIM
ncbi:uncharacterized protein LOC110887832 [Helianthus annuus]|uniref:uncharacterized protein LOC110887832 n=1 Tax=Helianthus annuus TaxID=4232 RepID=UPI000B8FABF7|nr:uncharacterized protein LOC110887832 [Helianthus annuus]